MNNGFAPFRRPLVALVAALSMCAANTPPRASAADATRAPGSESLGSELLDDLAPNLLGPPEDAPAKAPARPDFQKRILPGVADEWLGEDVGQSSPGRVLAWVERNMQTAANLLPHAESMPRAGEVQRQIVADLDKLIDELAQQCRSGACNTGGESDSPSQRSQAAPKPGTPKPGQGQSPARDSTSRLGRGDPRGVDPGEREQLIKDLWGHLPARAREQMLQSYSDEFLPEYELEIEQYFRRLAEEPDADGPARP
jgi:hypothetical protein